MRQRSDYFKRTHKVGADNHDCPCIVELTAIVGCGEDGQQLPVRVELVSIFHHLMRPADQIQIVSMEEIQYYVLSEGIRHTPASIQYI